jgi:CHASE3 domain sensor protein
MGQPHFSRTAKVLIGIGLLLPLLLVGIPALLVNRTAGEVKRSFQWVTHTQEVQRAVQTLINSLVDAETGQRGYLLTQRANYLEPYESARSRIDGQIKELRAQISDNAAQQKRLDELTPLVQERLALLDETVAQERSGNHEGALALVNSDRGKNTMDKIRALLRVMADEEQNLLWSRQRTATLQARRATTLLGGLVVASFACAGLVYFLVHRLSRIEPVVQMCASTRTIEYGGEWLSFEQYLQRRFGISTNHGLSPSEFERLRDKPGAKNAS